MFRRSTRKSLGLPIVLAMTSIAWVPQTALAGSEKTWDDASNIGEGLLLAAAFGLEAGKKDWHGGVQTLASTAGAFAITQGLKQAFPEIRPDRNGDDSFPSGHTAVSFAAAASLQNRYGWKVGLPAHAAAAFVGLARVEAKRHFWYDVVAGAAIGEATGLLLTTRQDQSVQVIPWGDAHGGGASVIAHF